MTNKTRLGVNIDHVATLRQTRGESYPSLVDAAHMSLDSGADQITIHLREDRRHIQDTDVPAIQMVTQKHNKPLNLELGANDEILQFAVEVKPDWICIVPEKREEKTTEGGLDLYNKDHFNKISDTCKMLKDKIDGVKISLFVESQKEILHKSAECEIDAVEIHTGDYARAVLENNPIEDYLKSFQQGYDQLKETSIGYHAGHGLTDKSLLPLVKQDLFKEYNIGHWIICDSVFCGLEKSIQKLKTIINSK